MFRRFSWTIAANTLGFAVAMGFPPPVCGYPVQQKLPKDALKSPIPNMESQKRAEILVKDIFKKDYAGAVQPSAKNALAKKLLQKAIETDDDPVGRFVLLREARDLSVQAGAIGTTLLAVDALASWYDVDSLEMKTDALSNAAKAVRTVSTTKAEAAAVLALLNQAVTTDNFRSATRLGPVATWAARAATDFELVKQVTLRMQEVEELHKGFERATKARASLEKDPADPDANLALGKYLCFLRSDWANGLPRLRLGSDPLLKSLAEADNDQLVDAADQIKVADQWWDLAGKENGLSKAVVFQRAKYWYEHALPKLKGLTKSKVEQRLLEIGKITANFSDAAKSAVLPLPHKSRPRDARWKIGGGTEESEAAVERGLKWLARKQQPDGRWRLDGDYPDKGSNNDTAGTAFGLLPMLAAGIADQHVQKGLDFLVHKQDKRTGNLGGGMYGHGLATMALCEGYAMTQDAQHGRAAQMAINFIVKAQHEAGGWRYAPRQAGDTSVSGWQIMALKSGQMAGLDVPKATVEMAMKYLESACDRASEGYGYVGRGSSPNMTAVALLCRQHVEAWGPENPRLLKGINNVIEPAIANGPSRNVYFYYYATQVMHRRGGEEWRNWNPKMRDFLIKTQDQDRNSPNYGSWSSAGDPHSSAGGRLMVTSLNLLTLEVYYRYPKSDPK